MLPDRVTAGGLPVGGHAGSRKSAPGEAVAVAMWREIRADRIERETMALDGLDAEGQSENATFAPIHPREDWVPAFVFGPG